MAIDNKHGFTNDKSCLTNLIAFYNDIIALVNKRIATDIIYLYLWFSETVLQTNQQKLCYG